MAADRARDDGPPAGLSEMERDHVRLLADRLADENADDRRFLRSDGRGAPGLLLALAWQTRDLAGARYLLDGDRDAFRSGVAEALPHYDQIIERALDADPLAVAWLVPRDAREAVICALAAGDRRRAREMARATCELGFPNQSRRRVGRAGLRAIRAILDEDDPAEALEAWERALEEDPGTGLDDERTFAVCRAIPSGDAGAVGRACDEVAGMVDEPLVLPKDRLDMGIGAYLSVVGVGLTNLARLEGLDVRPRDRRIPVDLLLPYSRRRAKARAAGG